MSSNTTQVATSQNTTSCPGRALLTTKSLLRVSVQCHSRTNATDVKCFQLDPTLKAPNGTTDCSFTHSNGWANIAAKVDANTMDCQATCISLLTTNATIAPSPSASLSVKPASAATTLHTTPMLTLGLFIMIMYMFKRLV